MGFLIYLIVGLYLINIPFSFILMPDYIAVFDNWIVFIGGVLVLIGGVKYFFSSKRKEVAI